MQSGNQRFSRSRAGSALLALDGVGGGGAKIKQMKWRGKKNVCVCVVKMARGAFHGLTNKLNTPVNQPVTARNFTTDLFALSASVRISALLGAEVPSSALSQHLPPGLLSEQHHFTLRFHAPHRFPLALTARLSPLPLPPPSFCVR